ncbi:MAG: S9 family peptidase [Ignavibacteria bacterium]|jgi:dienelactone hydrolase|nr:S9 family peptidase [Ignavibacteria bacterium]
MEMNILNNNKAIFIIFLLLLSSLSLQAKRNFTFDDAMKFEALRNPIISNDGKWFAYEAKQDRGDVTAHINSTIDSAVVFRIKNASNIKFANNSKWVAMAINSTQMEKENAKISKDKLENNSLKLIELETKVEYDAEDLDKFVFSEDSKWLAYSKKADKNKPKMEKFKEKSLGTDLILHHLASGTDITINWVSEFAFDTNARYIFYVVSSPKGKKDGVYRRELTREFAPEKVIITRENTHFSNIAWSKTANSLAFLSAPLSEKGEPENCSLNLWQENADEVKTAIADSTCPENWYLPHKNSLTWAEDFNLLYFGLKPLSEKFIEKEAVKFKEENFYDTDTLLAKSEVYVWHWNDPYTIPQQINQWDKWRKDQTYYAVYSFLEDKYIQLADTLVPQVIPANNLDFAIAYSYMPYRKETTWYGTYRDIYCINLKTGKKNKVVEKIEENGSLSQSGKFIVYYKDKHWFLYNTEKDEAISITQNLDNPFYNIFQDIPSNIYSCGFGGWVDNDKGFFLYDNWDIWYFETANLTNNKIITKGEGKEKNIKFTLRKIDRDKKYFNSTEDIIVHAFDKNNKNSGYFIANLTTGNFSNSYQMTNQYLQSIRKVKDKDQIVFSQEKYDVFPNYWIADLQFNSLRRISHLNLAIKDTFNWGTTELFEWKYQDTILQGYLIKPDNFNPKKKYPVFVYFYDQMSSRMNRFYMPNVTHRPVNQVYMDNYIMFFPDIKYGVGSPGPDAVNCILSGCRELAKTGIIDTNKSCIQGHSWGGYQTAYLVTQTDFFSAACAGAPVGNMTSAYSGIRLGSGRVRQFQYEAQQSRIGGNLWDSLQAYIRNSPVFFANKMKTPLLIEFGDIDEAVPWEQGIELYMAMRRAQAPAIMLQYVNEPHWQTRYWNKLDYSIKMKEFFDHYVLGKPAPDWIIKGQAYKGENFK